MQAEGPKLVAASGSDWLAALRTYLLASALGHLAWEVVQLPLYTIWSTGTLREVAFAVFHCTGGDLLIATACLALALVLAGRPEWPRRAFGRVAVLTLGSGLAYTVFSEWLNVSVRQAWAYSDLMPVIPVVGAGLAPALQWIVMPAAAMAMTRRRLPRSTA